MLYQKKTHILANYYTLEDLTHLKRSPVNL